MRKIRAAAKIVRGKVTKRTAKAGRADQYKAAYNKRYHAARAGGFDTGSSPLKLLFTSSEETAKVARYGDFRLEMRPGTSDVKTVIEVLRTQMYKKAFEATSEVWGDFGAHIGTFAVYALAHGAKQIYCWEPFPDSRALLQRNVSGYPVKIHCQAVSWTGKERALHLHGKTDARHTLREVRGRQTLQVQSAKFADVLKEHKDITAVKMDIEGSEIEILQNLDFPARIRVLTFEWSYSVEQDPGVLRKVLAKLRRCS